MDGKKLETLKQRALLRQLKALGMGFSALVVFVMVSGSSIIANPGFTDPTTWMIVGISGLICLPLPFLQLLMFSFNKGIRYHRLATYYVLECLGCAYSIIGLGSLKFVGSIGRAELYQEQVRYRDGQSQAVEVGPGKHTVRVGGPTSKITLDVDLEDGDKAFVDCSPTIGMTLAVWAKMVTVCLIIGCLFPGGHIGYKLVPGIFILVLVLLLLRNNRPLALSEYDPEHDDFRP